MTKKEFIQEWLNTIQGNIWKNEEILAFQEAQEDKDSTKIDATKHNIEQDKKSLEFMSKRNEISLS